MNEGTSGELHPEDEWRRAHGLPISGKNTISPTSPVYTVPRPAPYEHDIHNQYVVTGQQFVKNLVHFSSVASASGTIAAGGGAVLTTTQTPEGTVGGNVVLAVCEAELYEGTSVVGSMIFYPARGAGISSDKFRCYGGYDFLTSSGTESQQRYRVNIHNTTGTTANIFARTKWRYIVGQGTSTTSSAS